MKGILNSGGFRFTSILSDGFLVHSDLSGGLRLRNYGAVGESFNFARCFRFLSVFFCGGHSNISSNLYVCEQPIIRESVLFTGY